MSEDIVFAVEDSQPIYNIRHRVFKETWMILSFDF